MLKRGREERLRLGHLWVYQGEVGSIARSAAPGGLVDVRDHRGRFLGRGYYNPASQICIRLLTRLPESIDREFFARRLENAFAHRRRFYPKEKNMRLVYGESDFLPGLIVDRYGDYLVVQITTLGMEKQRETILALLRDKLAPRGIQERSEASVRRHEGLAERNEVCYGEIPAELVVDDAGLVCKIDLRSGQKTGYFLDQRENRRAAAALAANRRMLDCFCHTGMFGIAAARAGAKSVTMVDIDGQALTLAADNAALNEVAGITSVIEANAFDFLRAAVDEGRRYDLIVLDPPAFTKSKFRVEQALRGYKEINLRATKLLSPGGILVTCSCSHHISAELFQDMAVRAAADAGRRLRLLERRGHPPDHPVLLGIPETEYLKCLVLEAIS